MEIALLAHAERLDERVAFSVDAVKVGTAAVAVDGGGHGDAVLEEDEGRRVHLVFAVGACFASAASSSDSTAWSPTARTGTAGHVA